MYTTLEDFHADLDKVTLLLSMTALLKDVAGMKIPQETLNEISLIDKAACNHGDIKTAIIEGRESYDEADASLDISKIISLQDSAKENHSNLVVLNGTLLLFIAGRFESFVRETFEEFCKNIVIRANRFNDLPKEMRDNLIKFTSDVISNPRKYGHAEGGVKSFVKILSKNLIDDEDLSEVNHQCLSITHENMRPAILTDLFGRVGVKNIWEKISQQSQMQVYFETSDANITKSNAETFLNILMDKRNSIAHPSRSITWPDAEYILSSMMYFKALSSVLIDSLNALEFEIQKKIKDRQSVRH